MCFLSALFLDTEYQYFCIQSFRKPLLPAGYQMISRYVTKIEGEAICAKVATASNLRIKHPFKQPLSERGVSQGCAANSFSLSKSTDVSSKLVQKARDPKSIDSSVVRKDFEVFSMGIIAALLLNTMYQYSSIQSFQKNGSQKTTPNTPYVSRPLFLSIYPLLKKLVLKPKW
jgi:hypothetical protein